MPSQNSACAYPNTPGPAGPSLPYRALLEAMPLGVEQCDLSGRICYSNPAHHRILGYPSGELINRSIWDFEVNNIAREHLQKYIAFLIEQQPTPEPFLTKNQKKNGEIVDIEINWTYARDAMGKLTGFVAIIEDVTQSNQAAARLIESERNYAALYEQSPYMMCSVDVLTTNILRCNQTLADILGYSKQELLGKSLFQLYHPQCSDKAQRSFERFVATGTMPETELILLCKNGQQIDISLSASAVKDVSGLVVEVRTIWRDISERKQAEAALQTSHAKLQRVLDSIIAYVGLLTPAGVIIEANRAPLESAGLSRDEVIGRPLVDTPWFAHCQHEQDALRDTVSQVAAGKTVRRDFFMQTRPGKIATVDAVFSPLKNTAGEVIEIVISSIDVTHRRRMEDDLLRLNEELELRVAERTAALHDKNQELEAFAHSVSHDLRAPLRAMEGFATALKEDFGDSLGDDRSEYVGHILASARRMDRLIHDLLSYSRLGRREIRFEAVNLRSVFTEAIATLQQEIRDTGADVQLPEILPWVRGHTTILVQSVANLLSNAVKFVDVGVTPRIRVHAEHRRCGRVRVWVEDNGIGISKQHKDQVFKVFQRLHGVESYPGTGIGLAIVRRACERLGGACGVESGPGIGSRFWIELPSGSPAGAAN